MADFNNISTVSTLQSAGSSAFSTAEFRSVSPATITTSINGRKQVKTLRSQHWEFKAVFPPMTSADFKPINAFLTKQRGQYGTFTIRLPLPHDGSITTGTATGTVGSTSITVSATGTLKAGDFISFNDSSNNHQKVYMIADDATLSGSGTVNIVPAIQETVSSKTFYTGASVEFLVRQIGDTQRYNIRSDGYYRHEVELEEVI